MDYADRQLALPEAEQYADALSPPLFLALALLVAHAAELAMGDANTIVASHHGKARLVGKDVRPRSSHPRRHDGAGQSTTGLPRHEPVIGEPDERSERGIRDGGRRRAHRAARDQPVATGCLTARSDDERRAVHVPAEIGAPRRSEAIVRPDRRKDADW